MAFQRNQIDAIFNPRVVAVVGGRKLDDYTWLRNMRDFTGKVYSVQIAPDDIPGIEEMGIPNYKSLVEIPEPVDYVVIAVPRGAVPIVLKDAIAKGVKTVHIFTSGFSETGTEQGTEMEQQIRGMAEDAGVLVIGPNCMGPFNPANGMRFSPAQDVDKSGSVAIISQSGGHAASLIAGAQSSGVGVSKGVSFGNGLILNSADLLEYFADDPETSIICGYIEGLVDGQRFFQVLQKAVRQKPVILWKGGQTVEGSRMAASHTGSLAGATEIWDAMIRQTGAIRADSLEEAVDAIKALAYLTPTTGDGVGIIGGTGGQSVTMSDDFSRAKLRVPTLSDETLEALGSYFQLIGASYFNPVDVGGINRGNLETTIDLLAMDPNVDSVALLVGAFGVRRPREEVVGDLELYAKARDKAGKPVMAMFWSPVPYRDGPAFVDLDETLQNFAIPAFASPARAAQALRKMVDYYRFRASVQENDAL
jgi:acyl-CoA synthetase (NDP forming)